MVATRRHPDGSFPEHATITSTATNSAATKTTTTTPAILKPGSSSKKSGYTHRPTPLLILWLLLSMTLVVWDTLYMLLRPHTMPGGLLHWPIWTPYALYGSVDYIYGWPAWQEQDGFGPAQSTLNVVETLMYGAYLWVVWARARGSSEQNGGEGNVGEMRGDGERKVVWLMGWSEQGRWEVVQGPGVGLAVVVAFAATVMTVSKTVLYGLHEYYSGFANVGHNDPLTLLIYWIIPNGAWLVFPTYMTYVLGTEIVDALNGCRSDADGGGKAATAKAKRSE